MIVSDFSDIHLLPEEEAALRRYAALDHIPDDAPHLEAIRRYGLLCRVDMQIDDMGSPYGGRLIVSDHGRRFLNWLDEKAKERHVSIRQFRITTAIAIVALIVSIFSLLLQVLQAIHSIDLSLLLPR